MPHRDFTTDLEAQDPVTFTVGTHAYEYKCVPIDEAPAGLLLDVGTLGGDSTTKQQLEALAKFLDAIMDENSSKHFAKRMNGSIKPAVGLKHLTELVEWLVEVYGARPPEPSPTSPGSSRTNGRQSTPARSKPASTR